MPCNRVIATGKEGTMTDKRAKISRREIFKLAGAGGGAIAAANVVGLPGGAAKNAAGKFSDPAGRPKRPWWVRTVDEPTIEIDWDKMERYNERYVPELG
jgi:hypothetical protein